MKIKKSYFVLLFLFSLLFSCKKQNKSSQENNKGYSVTSQIINQYKGLWYCESSDVFQELLDMGLVMQLGIYTDGRFNITAVIGNEQQLLNTGEWTLSDSMDKCTFILPDQEYGGTIHGTFSFTDNKLYYCLEEHPNKLSVFVKY